MIDGLVSDVAAWQVGGERNGALLRNAGDGFDRVGDACEVEGHEAERLVWGGRGEGWGAVQNTVGDSVCCNVDAGLRLDAGGDDARDALLEDVPGVVLEALVSAYWVDLGESRDGWDVVVGSKLRDSLGRGLAVGCSGGEGQEGERNEACELHFD